MPQKIQNRKKVEGRIITFIVPSDVGVHEDTRTKAKSIAFPFDYLSGKHGLLILTKITNGPWRPSDEIVSLTVTLKTYDN